MTPSARPPSPEALLEHREWLRAVARNLVGDENSVDDVEQRVWLTVLRNRRPVVSVRAWLRRVVRSAAVDDHRSTERRRARETAAARAEALPPTDHLAAQADAQRAVAQAVTNLPEPYRTTVLLRYFEELPIEGVAARMGAPVETVRTRLRRAHALLRDALDSEFGDRRTWALALLPLARGKVAATSAATATGAVTTGVLAMAGTKKVVAAVALLVLLAGGAATWMTLHEAGPSDDAAGVIPPADAVGPDGAAAARVTRRPAPADAPRVALEGRVRCRQDGLPVAAARVVVEGSARTSVAELETAADGTFRCEDVPAAAVRVEARGFRGARIDVPTRVGAVADLGEVWLDAATGLVVEVRGPRDAPVEGAEVQLVRRAAHGEVATTNSFLRSLADPDFRIERLGAARTDAAGAARFGDLAPGSYSLTMRRAGLATATEYAQVPAGRAETRVTIRATAGHHLAGRVVTASGDPAAGRFVCAGGAGWDEKAYVISDAGGRFAFDDVPAGEIALSAGRARGESPTLAKVQVPGAADVVLRLPPTGVVTGRVALADGSAVAGAEVGIEVTIRHPNVAGFYVRTDEGGRFRADDVPAGQLSRFEVRHAGLYHLGGRVVAEVEADKETVLDATMAPGARLHGRVLSPDGPVAGAWVFVQRFVPREDHMWETAVSDAEGRYSFDFLPPGVAAVVPSHSGYVHPGAPMDLSEAMWRKTVPPGLLLDLPAGGDVARDFHLVAGTRVAGRVIGPDGKGVAGADVRFDSRYGRAPTPVAVSGADGAFVLARVSGPGTSKLRVESPGLCQSNVPEVTLAPGGRVDGIEVRMVPRPRISGRVTDTTGVPIDGARVSLQTSDPDGRRADAVAWTGATGEYVLLAARAEGTAVVTASADGRGEARIEVALAADVRSADVVLSSSRPFTGRLVPAETGPDSPSLAGARVAIRAASEEPEWWVYGDPLNPPGPPMAVATVGADGLFEVPLAPGSYSLWVSGAGLVETSIVVDVPARAAIDVPVRRSTTLSGALRGDDGKPLARAWVVLDPSPEIGTPRLSVPGTHEDVMREGGSAEHLLLRHTDAAGAFAFPGIPEGEYALVVVAPTASQSAPSEVRFGPLRPSAGPYDLSLAAPLAASISGRVLDADGGVYAEAKFTIVVLAERVQNRFGAPRPPAIRADAAADGTFRIEGLTASSYTLQVHVDLDPRPLPDGRTGWFRGRTRTFRGVRAGATDVVLRMTEGAVVRGRLVDENGTPVAQGVVAARSAEGFTSQPMIPSQVSSRTGVDGVFEIRDLEDAPYVLELASYGGTSQRRRIDPAPKVRGTTDVGDLVVTLEARLRGRVVDAAGAAVAGAAVDVWPKTGGGVQKVVTDADGLFEATGLDPGAEYNVMIADGKHHFPPSPSQQVAVPGATDVKLVRE